MTQELPNGDVCLLPMNNEICQQGRKVHSPGRVGWIAGALIAVVAFFGSVPAYASSGRVRRAFLTLIATFFLFSLVSAAHAAVTVNAGYTTFADAGNLTSHVINTPTHSAGDVIYLFAAIDGVSTMTPPSGFAAVTNINAADIASAATTSLWTKTATGSEPSTYTWTSGTSERAVQIAWSQSGDGGVDVSATANTGSGTAVICPAATTTVANTLILRLVASDALTDPITTGSGYTKLAELSFTSAATASVQYITQAAIGTTGTLGLTLTIGDDWKAFTVAIKPVKDIYYSVGTSTSDLKTGSPTITISSGTATLTVAQIGNIGVGDVITYNTTSKAYIKSVVNNTTFVVQTAIGGTPAPVSGQIVNTIMRVFNSIATAESNSPGASYLTTSNLVTGNYQLNWVCYNDGTPSFSVGSATNISGWTTDSTHYLTLTVAGASQVASGISQRHTGIAGTGVVLKATASSGYAILVVDQQYTRVEWLELDGNEILNVGGFEIQSNADYSLFRQLIIHNLDGGTLDANAFAVATGADNVQIRNVIAYYYDADGIYTGGSNLTVYNSTFYYGRTSPSSNSIQVTSGASVTAYNVITAGQESDYYSQGTLTLYNCMSEGADADDYGGSGNLINKAASNQFVSLSGTIDLHLKAGSDAINAGYDLSGTFTDDIDGHGRPYGSAWDIGADEYTGTGIFEYRRLITVDRTKIRNPATFPIAWDSVSSGKTVNAGAGSLTWSHTVGAGNDRILIVGVSIRNAGGQTVTGVTYNGLALTLIGSANNAGNVAAYMYYRLAPPTGTYSIIVTLSASAAFVAGAVSLFNVDQTTPFGTFASATGSGTATWAAFVDVPSANGEIVVATLAKQYNYAVQPEQQTSQADRWNLSTTNGTSADILGVGTLRGGQATARAYWALTGAPTQQWAIGGVPVKPTTAAPPQITSLSNYPLLVSLSDTTLRDTAHSGHVGNSNGYDILFRASDGKTQLDHEIEKYDGVNGQVVAWVRLPSVNGAGAASDTQIYMYYGDGSISLPTQNKAAVWDSNYMDVFHLAESSPNNAVDSKNGYVGTISNESDVTRAPAKIDGGYHFGGNSYIVTNDAALTSNAPFTMEAWFYLDSTPQNWIGIVTKNRDVNPCPDTPPYCDWVGIWTGPTGTLVWGWDWHTQGNMTGTIVPSAATWYHAVGIFDGGIRTFYRNGVRDTDLSPNPSPGVYTNMAMPTRMNRDMGTGNIGTGTTDEVRISTIARPPGWILTTYDNMNNPGNIGSPGFYTVGNEENFPPTAVKLTSLAATEYEGGVLLRWKTGYEVSNLGFHVYREENGQLIRLTPEPVAGSAFLAGKGTSLTAGRHYHWWDTSLNHELSAISHQPSSVRYWLKDIDLNGKHTMHGPVTPVISREPIPEKLRPELLSEVGHRLQVKYRDFWRVQELKEKLNDRYRSRSTSFKDRFAQGALTLEAKQNRLLPSSPAGTLLKGRRPAPVSSRPEADRLVQQYLAGKPAVKLFVKEEGWYRVSQSELVAAGLSPRVNPHYLQLYVDGREQAIRVIGEKDGRFGPRDAIEFYGMGLDTPSTDTRVYWLIEGHKAGKRIREYKSHGGQISSLSFPHTVEKKERTLYFAALKNGDEENFFGPVVYMNQVNQILELRHLDRATTEDALLEVVLQGATEGPHQVKVLLNEAEAGEIVFEGQRKGTLRVEIPQSILEEENLVSLVAMGDEMDATLLDSIRLTYWHTYTAEENGLRLTAHGGNHFTINGFSHSNIRVFDITDSNEVIEVIGKVGSQKGSYAITFRVPENGERTLLALTEEKAKNPIEVVSNHPSRWHQERSGYDFIVISHRDFTNNLQPLKKLRESQGLKVALIDVEDLYDEFSFGHKSPKALKDFLGLAKKKWNKPPRFVLLVGDASFDPRNYLGLGDMDFVPTKLIDTVYMETASDDWFVDFNNDGLPEMAIGRIPVQTPEEAAIVVSKIVGYEKSTKKNEALLVADRADNSDDFNFEGASEEVRALLPAYLMVRKIFRGDFSSDVQAKGELLNGINQGALLVNFIGHGSVESWRGSLLTLEDADSLINGLRLPFFVNMTCLNGFFQNPYGETLAEALMKAKGGGAIAIWTSSGLTEPDKQAVMNKELIKLLFGRESITLGEATAKAKASVPDQDIRRTWILFGDPTTRLK